MNILNLFIAYVYESQINTGTVAPNNIDGMQSEPGKETPGEVRN